MASGVARVVVAVLDPDARVSGRGVARAARRGPPRRRRLRPRRGRGGPRARTCTSARRAGPYVVLKWAATLDGRTAAPDGTSRWITSEPARRDVHRLRADSDAVLVGAGTVRADDPELTVRLDGRRAPAAPRRARRRAAQRQGAPVPRVHAASSGRSSTTWAPAGVLQLLVEGGARVAHDFVAQGLVDRVVAYVAPALLGGDDGAPVLRGPGAADDRRRVAGQIRVGRHGGRRSARGARGLMALVVDRRGRRRDRGGLDGRRRRRRGPRERGRPRDGGRGRDARVGGVLLAAHLGVICAPIEPERADALDLPLMVHANTEAQRTAFIVSVDLPPRDDDGDLGPGPRGDDPRPRRPRDGRAGPQPARATSSPCATGPAASSSAPGTPRRPSTCAAWQGARPPAMLCELVTPDKAQMARLADLERFAAEHGLPIISIADLIRYRRTHERLVERMAAGRAADRRGRVPRRRLPLAPRQRAAPRLGARRRRRQAGRARPGPLRVPDRRRLRLAALRLRHPAAGGPRPDRSRRAAASSSTCAGTRAAASASGTRSAPTRCKRTAATPSTPTSSWASPPRPASTGSARRSSWTSASRRCGS